MIGLFDSGSGGLTVLAALRKKAPHADIVYFGDIKNAPYGEKTEIELMDLTKQGIQFLKEKGMMQLISACNSVSAVVLAGAAGSIPFIEMSLPTGEYLKQFQRKRFLLIATPATIASKIYERATAGIITVDPFPIPYLAGAIEFDYGEEKIEEIIKEAFVLRRGEHYDGIILGCTHYPLVIKSIEKIVVPYFGRVAIIDPASFVAEAVCKNFSIVGSGVTKFFISQKSDGFENKIKSLFPDLSYTIEVV